MDLGTWAEDAGGSRTEAVEGLGMFAVAARGLVVFGRTVVVAVECRNRYAADSAGKGVALSVVAFGSVLALGRIREVGVVVAVFAAVVALWVSELALRNGTTY